MEKKIRTKMNKKWVSIWTLILALPIVYAQRFGYPSDLFGGLGGFGGGYGGFFDFGGLYTLYPGWLDFLIFFLIFSGVARLVFTKWFGDQAGAKALYVGVGFALAFGGVYYDYLSLANFGTFAFPFLMLIGGGAVFGFLRLIGMNKFGATLMTLGVILLGAPLFDAIGGTSYGGYLFNFVDPQILNTSAGILVLVGVIWGIIHLIRKHGGRVRDINVGGPAPPTLSGHGPKKPGIFKRLFSDAGREYRGDRDEVRRRFERGEIRVEDAYGKAAKKAIKKLYDFIEKSYIAFTQLQYARLTKLVELISEWIKIGRDYEVNKNRTIVGIEELKKELDDKKRQITKLLRQINAGTRYQLRMLQRGRKAAEHLRYEKYPFVEKGKEIAGIFDNLESADHYFRLYIGQMITAVEKDDYIKVETLYTSLRSIFTEMLDSYKKLESMRK